jgi:imidazoleglycerol phosphate synthase glutamine amidotransferase subunit HisH
VSFKVAIIVPENEEEEEKEIGKLIRQQINKIKAWKRTPPTGWNSCSFFHLSAYISYIYVCKCWHT